MAQCMAHKVEAVIPILSNRDVNFGDSHATNIPNKCNIIAFIDENFTFQLFNICKLTLIEYLLSLNIIFAAENYTTVPHDLSLRIKNNWKDARQHHV